MNVLKKSRFLVPLLLVLLLPFLMGIAAPDSGPFITKVDVYRHCLETDDLLVVVRYNAPYDPGPPDTIPDESITQAFIGRLMSGSTELARISPYSYYRRGYGYGMFSMYLDAASAAGLWEDPLTVEFVGSPTLSWTPSVPSVATGSLNWRATTSMPATQALMRAHLLVWADELSDYWDIALTTSGATGTVLSSYGEAYFTNAISGLRTMVPALFSAGTAVPQYEEIDWQKGQAEAITSTWPFEWGGMSQYLGLPSDDEVFRTLVGFGMIFMVCAVLMARTSRPDFVMLAGYGLLVVLTVPGWISPIMLAGVTFLAVLGAALVFVLGKAG